MCPFEELNKQDAHNYQEVKKGIGAAAAALPDDVLSLYDLHTEAIAAHVTTAASRLAGALIIGVCRKHLMLGTTALFRLYSSQMFRETRSAVEAAGIAYAIQHDSNKLRIFQQDDGTPQKRQAVARHSQEGSSFRTKSRF